MSYPADHQQRDRACGGSGPATAVFGSRPRTQRRLAALVLLTLLGLITACGGNDTSPGSGDGSARHNAADVTFASDMVPHHTQALDMARLAVRKGSSSKKVVDLANQIQDAQRPEIETMTSWLESWGEPVPDPGMAGTGHGGMNHGDMTGMMSAEDMRQLTNAEGSEFDEIWLRAMIKHHEGAIAMATAEVRDGRNASAKGLAQDIIDTQQAEIATMDGLL